MMTFPSDNSLINYDRMTREVICLNPTHSTVTMRSNETQPKCPICENVMITVVKSVLTQEIVTKPREE